MRLQPVAASLVALLVDRGEVRFEGGHRQHVRHAVLIPLLPFFHKISAAQGEDTELRPVLRVPAAQDLAQNSTLSVYVWDAGLDVAHGAHLGSHCRTERDQLRFSLSGAGAPVIELPLGSAPQLGLVLTGPWAARAGRLGG